MAIGRRGAGEGPPGLTREQILEEAARLFREQGYENTRLKDVATRFGVTHAALYYYFPRKSDMLAALNYEALDKLLEGARKAAEEGVDPADRFQRQLEAHIRFIVENAPLAASFFQFDNSLEPADHDRIRALRLSYTELLTDTFVAAQKAGAVSAAVDRQVAVNTLLGAANWMYRWLNVEDLDLDADQIARQVGGLLADGFRTR